MGCVSSSLLQQDDDFPQMGTAALGHHFVSLTSTTYGLLTLDPHPPPSPSPSPSPMTPPTPPPRFTLTSPAPEVINSWELMAGLDSNSKDNSNQNETVGSFRFTPIPNSLSSTYPKFFSKDADENVDPNIIVPESKSCQRYSLEHFPKICPREGEDKVVLYTTSLRGVRKTFEACNAVRSVLQGLGFAFCERDISMDRGFRDELKRLLNGSSTTAANKPELLLLPPHLFIKGRYIGSAESVLGIHEEGGLQQLLEGLPRVKVGTVCDGCGNVRFMPCFRCNGSCKLVTTVKDDASVVIRCPDCNENGLVLCPICS